jgi:hypothetical protein
MACTVQKMNMLNSIQLLIHLKQEDKSMNGLFLSKKLCNKLFNNKFRRHMMIMKKWLEKNGLWVDVVWQFYAWI